MTPRHARSALLAVVASCSGPPTEGAPEASLPRCAPHTVSACPCPGGDVAGSQRCLADGTFDRCMCPTVTSGLDATLDDTGHDDGIDATRVDDAVFDAFDAAAADAISPDASDASTADIEAALVDASSPTLDVTDASDTSDAFVRDVPADRATDAGDGVSSPIDADASTRCNGMTIRGAARATGGDVAPALVIDGLGDPARGTDLGGGDYRAECVVPGARLTFRRGPYEETLVSVMPVAGIATVVTGTTTDAADDLPLPRAHLIESTRGGTHTRVTALGAAQRYPYTTSGGAEVHTVSLLDGTDRTLYRAADVVSTGFSTDGRFAWWTVRATSAYIVYDLDRDRTWTFPATASLAPQFAPDNGAFLVYGGVTDRVYAVQPTTDAPARTLVYGAGSTPAWVGPGRAVRYFQDAPDGGRATLVREDVTSGERTVVGVPSNPGYDVYAADDATLILGTVDGVAGTWLAPLGLPSRRIGTDPTTVVSPVKITPDGRRAVYPVRARAGGFDLVAMDLAAGTTRTLHTFTTNIGVDHTLDLIDDHQAIVFSATGLDPQGGTLYAVDLDTGDVRVLVARATSWQRSSDGAYVVASFTETPDGGSFTARVVGVRVRDGLVTDVGRSNSTTRVEALFGDTARVLVSLYSRDTSVEMRLVPLDGGAPVTLAPSGAHTTYFAGHRFASVLTTQPIEEGGGPSLMITSLQRATLVSLTDGHVVTTTDGVVRCFGGPDAADVIAYTIAPRIDGRLQPELLVVQPTDGRPRESLRTFDQRESPTWLPDGRMRFSLDPVEVRWPFQSGLYVASGF